MNAYSVEHAFDLIRLVWFSNPTTSDDRMKRLRECSLTLIGAMANLSVFLCKETPPSESAQIAVNGSQDHSNPSPFSHETSLQKQLLSSMTKYWVRFGSLSLSKEHTGLVNVCWKSVTEVVQMTNGHDGAEKHLNITHILKTLFDLMAITLRQAFLLSLSKEGSNEKEAKKNGLLMKFFLQHCIRIAFAYPYCAYVFARHFVLLSSSFLILLYPEMSGVCGKTAAMFTHSSGFALFDLVHKLLSFKSLDKSAQLNIIRSVSDESFSQWPQADSVNKDEKNKKNIHPNSDRNCNQNGGSSCANVDDDATDPCGQLLADLDRAGLWKLGQFLCVLTWMQGCLAYEAELLCCLSEKLFWVIDTVSKSNGVYASLFSFPSHAFPPGNFADHPSETSNTKSSVFSHTVNSISTLFVAIEGTKDNGKHAWDELERFLFKNAFHSNAVCSELVQQVWEFVFRHADSLLINHHLNSLMFFFQGSVVHELNDDKGDPSSIQATDQLARVICRLVLNSPKETLRWLSDNGLDLMQKPTLYSIEKITMVAVLLKHGFPLYFLIERDHRNEESGRWLRGHLMACKEISAKIIQDGIPLKREHFCFLESSLTCIHHALEQIQGNSISISESDLNDLCSTIFQLLSLQGLKGEIINSCWYSICTICLQLSGMLWPRFLPSSKSSTLVSLANTLSSLPESNSPSIAQMKVSLAGFLQNKNVVSSASAAHFESLQRLYHALIGENQWALLHHVLLAYMSMASSSRLDQLWKFEPRNVKVVIEDNVPMELIGNEDERKSLDGHELFTRTLHACHERLAMIKSPLKSNTRNQDLLAMECERMVKKRRIHGGLHHSVGVYPSNNANGNQLDEVRDEFMNVDEILRDMEKKLHFLEIILKREIKIGGFGMVRDQRLRMENMKNQICKLQEMLQSGEPNE